MRTGNFDEDVRVNARRLLDLFEGHLRSDPGQWAVLEPIWRAREGEPAASPRV
jgi:lauroyl/myristoyl acyltransferase